eukprot:CAMPEP_0113631978 /NCGR_PEP_ID=MMETSP0017_2-20120614/16620_1 /TAXON_ID=2856 /ORGANISM="Cylindrotheca closterium" /LENGTH=271 /DNA_ID=CAMNT_0000542513 /DNA_START=31 /DNA_END=846 /DNA_ORIENTATION=- /assembly_acc=CAM_ASM_000147
MATLIHGSCNIRGLIGITKVSKRLHRTIRHHGTPKIELFVFQSRQLSSNDDRHNVKNNDSEGKWSGDKNNKPHTSVWEQLQSPPNIITLTRIASTPVLAYCITSEQYVLAVWGCALAGMSDALDGYLAKTYNWGTTVGTYLDPVADKIMVNSLAVSLWYTSILPTPLIAVWAIKDIGLLSGTAWMLYKNYNSINFFTTSLAQKPLEVKPSQVAKVNTALQFATLGVGIISPISSFSPTILNTLCWTTAATTVGSVLSYAGQSAIKQTSKGD